jgi:hypothetical protein
MKDNTLSGAGPWTFEIPELSPGESHTVDLRKAEKGRYRRNLPMDEILIKNYDVDNRTNLNVNGVYNADVDPNGKDSYGEVGISSFRITNRGNTKIAAGDVTATVKKDPYDADDQARTEAAKGPVRRVIENFTGL